jgi:hypothetical protein
MKIGTKTLLFGVHCIPLHAAFLFRAWWKLYGFPFDPRLWLAFLVHDIGYWGRTDLDGKDGKRHPVLGAKIMGRLFGERWADFCLLHSRSMARRLGCNPSRLCYADKYAQALIPTWLFLFLAGLTGELDEHMHAPWAMTPAGDQTPEQWWKRARQGSLAVVRAHVVALQIDRLKLGVDI